MLTFQLNFTPEVKVDVANVELDVDEGENKYQRRKNASGFLGKLIKAHEVHPKYAVSTLLEDFSYNGLQSDSAWSL